MQERLAPLLNALILPCLREALPLFLFCPSLIIKGGALGAYHILDFDYWVSKISLVRCIDCGGWVKFRAEVTCSGLPEPLLSHRSLISIVQY